MSGTETLRPAAVATALSLVWLAAGLSGCAIKQDATGLVQVAEGRAVMLRDGAGELTLAGGKRAEAVRYLGGCTLDVSGPLLGRRLWVRDWTVVTAFDGSEPYVGVVGRRNGELAISDQNSGSVFLLDPKSAGTLASYEGELVMIMGFVSGPQLLQVMGYRVLTGH